MYILRSGTVKTSPPKPEKQVIYTSYLYAWTLGNSKMDTTSANSCTDTINAVVTPKQSIIHWGASGRMSNCANGAREKPTKKWGVIFIALVYRRVQQSQRIKIYITYLP